MADESSYSFFFMFYIVQNKFSSTTGFCLLRQGLLKLLYELYNINIIKKKNLVVLDLG